MLKRCSKFIVEKSKFLTAAVAAMFMVAIVPNLARADAITDAIKDFDTANILAAGAAIIGLVIAVVGIKWVVRLMKGA